MTQDQGLPPWAAWTGKARSLVPIGLVVALTGCDPSLRLVVEARSDWVPGFEAQELRLDIEGRAPVVRPLEADEDLLDGIRVAEIEELARGPLRLELSVNGPGGLVATRPMLVELSGDQVVTVVLSRDCQAARCPTEANPLATACLNATCVEPTCTRENADACGQGCAADSDCPSVAASCALARCQGRVCVAVPTGECTDEEFCRPEEGCLRRGPSECDVDLCIDHETAGVDEYDSVRATDGAEFRVAGSGLGGTSEAVRAYASATSTALGCVSIDDDLRGLRVEFLFDASALMEAGAAEGTRAAFFEADFQDRGEHFELQLERSGGWRWAFEAFGQSGSSPVGSGDWPISVRVEFVPPEIRLRFGGSSSDLRASHSLGAASELCFGMAGRSMDFNGPFVLDEIRIDRDP